MAIDSTTYPIKYRNCPFLLACSYLGWKRPIIPSLYYSVDSLLWKSRSQTTTLQKPPHEQPCCHSEVENMKGCGWGSVVPCCCIWKDG